jgi:hypothetical protein
MTTARHTYEYCTMFDKLILTDTSGCGYVADSNRPRWLRGN